MTPVSCLCPTEEFWFGLGLAVLFVVLALLVEIFDVDL